MVGAEERNETLCGRGTRSWGTDGLNGEFRKLAEGGGIIPRTGLSVVSCGVLFVEMRLCAVATGNAHGREKACGCVCMCVSVYVRV